MNQDDLSFEEFLSSRMRDKGITLKRLAETTGIAPTHLEKMLHGNFDEMPSTPYFRGYVIRVGKVLDFDGEEWWKRLRQGNPVKNSGPADSLPKNRFIKKEISNTAWAIGICIVILVVYLIIMFPRITGKPAITVTYPPNNPFTTGSSTITLAGTVSGADELYLSSDSASSSQEITVGQNGSWQETVLLGGGVNSFELSAKKLLGGEADVTEEIVYIEPAVGSTTTATSTASTTSTL